MLVCKLNLQEAIKITIKKKLSILTVLCAVLCLIAVLSNTLGDISTDTVTINPSKYEPQYFLSDSTESRGEGGGETGGGEVNSGEEDNSSRENGEETDKININTATAEQLADFLPGIGPVKAKSIVEYRESVGKFNSVSELIEVSGIGQATLDKIAPYCTV
ncbi:MAG: helix-hairpin-helix domain-containing protein [Oscillospiraceae bacterium]|jgi:competence protein ComEA|nr:helix-hairpin-helix domain-containing protein [Oscillospiraceae bacterium]